MRRKARLFRKPFRPINMLSVILFILVLTFLILIHELGHFIVARINKVHIEEFGIGLPPKAITLFHWKGIPITLNWIFLGGFVRMEGEDKAVEELRVESKNKKQTTKNDFPFYQRALWQKILIVLAGPTVNIVFGMLVFSAYYSKYGIPETNPIPVTISQIADNSPAQKADLRVNDIVKDIHGSDASDTLTVSDVQSLTTYINAHRGQTLTMTVERDGTQQHITVYARKTEEIPTNEGSVGVALSDTKVTMKFYPGLEQPYRGTIFGIQESFAFSKMVLSSLGGIGSSIANGRVPKDISGPVGIAHEVQKENLFGNGWATSFRFAALLSINLGVMNLLPIPALDGGRIALLILEKFFKGKKFEALSQNLNQFGFLFLIGILILITIKDVIGIFIK